MHQSSPFMEQGCGGVCGVVGGVVWTLDSYLPSVTGGGSGLLSP